jgi:hypothetical protein
MTSPMTPPNGAANRMAMPNLAGTAASNMAMPTGLPMDMTPRGSAQSDFFYNKVTFLSRLNSLSNAYGGTLAAVDCAIQSFPSPYEVNSLNVPGTATAASGVFITPISPQTLVFGLDDFTIEALIYPTVATSAAILDLRESPFNAKQPVFATNSNNTIGFAYDIAANGGASFNSVGTFSLNVWSHVAVVMKSGILTFFINGQPSGSSALVVNFTRGLTPRIGNGSFVNAPMVGNIGSLRVTKAARYTAKFTPTRIP